MEGVRKGKTKKTRCDEGRAPTCVSWFKAGKSPENQRCTGCVAGNTFGMYFRRRLSSPSARMMPRMPCAVLRSNRQSFKNSLLVLPKFDKCCLCSFGEFRLRHQIPKQKKKRRRTAATPLLLLFWTWMVAIATDGYCCCLEEKGTSVSILGSITCCFTTSM